MNVAYESIDCTGNRSADETYNHKAANLRHLAGLKLALLITHKDMFDVNLLIGAAFYWSVDTIIRGDSQTAAKSKVSRESKNGAQTTSMMNVLVIHKTEEVDLERF